MKIVMNLKREIKYASAANILVFIAISLLCCLVSQLFCRNMRYYYQILLPAFALSAGGFCFLRMLMFALSGFAAGLVSGNTDKCRKKKKTLGLIVYALLLICVSVWCPLTFGGCCFILGFILSLGVVALSFAVMRIYVKVSLIAGFSMLVFLLWSIYCSVLAFCILLLN